jgi:alkylation response protein AidB-like acyl-CoA dehydrogenase
MYAFSPSPGQQALREEILAFVADALMPADGSLPEGIFERERWRRCGRIGLPGLAIPEEYGGRGLGALDTTLVLEALGYAHPDNGLNFALSAHLLACVVPLWLSGSQELRRRYLPGLCDGSLIAANAMSEPSSGSDAFTMQTIAEADGNEYVIDGAKSFVSNGPVADNLLLYAATDPGRGFMGGISAFWLDREIHPYQAGPALDKAGLTGSPLGSLYFSQTRVGEDFMVGPKGRGAHLFNRSMEWERVCLGAGHLGNLQRLLEKAVDLLRGQLRSGFSRETRQSATHELAVIQSELEAVRLLSYAAAWKMDQGKPASREAAMSKLRISELYKQATLRIALLFNGAGIFDPDVERSQRDALSSTIYSGTSEMQKTIIAQIMGL